MKKLPKAENENEWNPSQVCLLSAARVARSSPPLRNNALRQVGISKNDSGIGTFSFTQVNI